MVKRVENQTGWRVAYKGDLPQIINLICQDERSCMGLSSLIYNNGNIELPSNRGKIFLFFEENTPSGVLYYSNEGLLYPFFSKKFLTDKTVLQRKINLLADMLSPIRPYPYFIAGVAESVELLGSCFPQIPPLDSYNYFCMKRVGMADYKLPTPDGCTLYRAGPGDLMKLFSLEIAYQQEEVIRKDQPVNILVLKRRFKDQLKNEIIFYLEKNGEAVAKAGTNAKGFTHRQLGGVYTRPDYRNRGFSTFLTSALISKVMEEMRGSTLFVKKNNLSAIQVYKKCKFIPCGDFRIDYFR